MPLFSRKYHIVIVQQKHRECTILFEELFIIIMYSPLRTVPRQFLAQGKGAFRSAEILR